ncbi:alpha/beta hydrolase [Rhizobium sp. BK376]|uniref:alpha/beta hydrolase fold domain-containing protein n=1 Tax=Rhizobium sp. BK376 TaxID=2512149 RepID=UPI001046C493|nr:alpha/beta hydrolase [Rhizobium sp. BK376]TCR93407.1 acetyl esterase/lipase [Rhizobium sp. BK376]
MTQTYKLNMSETRHPISAADREAEIAVLAAMGAHFTNMTGTMRDAYDAMTETTPIAEGVTLEEVDEPQLKGWWVRPEQAPSDRAILFIHGGAYVLGSARAYRGLASQLAIRTGVASFVLDYPLAPEHPFPAAFDAAVAARRWLGERGFGQIALTGDSAGGALVFGAMATEDIRSEVASVVVFSPWIDLALTGASFNDPATYDPIFLPPQILTKAAETYLAGAAPKDGRASPLYDIPKALPPLAIQVGTDELLLDDARRYAAAAAAQGGKVQLDIYEGLHHVFQRSVMELQGARHALDDAAVFMKCHWR